MRQSLVESSSPDCGGRHEVRSVTSRRESGTQRQTGRIKPAVVSSCSIVPQEKKNRKTHDLSLSKPG